MPGSVGSRRPTVFADCHGGSFAASFLSLAMRVLNFDAVRAVEASANLTPVQGIESVGNMGCREIIARRTKENGTINGRRSRRRTNDPFVNPESLRNSRVQIPSRSQNN